MSHLGSIICHSPFQGTRRYQSLAVLLSSKLELSDTIPPHDYLDDLESFLYVLSELMFKTFCPVKKMNPSATVFLKLWADRDVDNAIHGKASFLFQPLDPRLVDSEYWGVSCVQLLQEFHSFIRSVVNKKADIRIESNSHQEEIAKFKAMGDNGKIAEHYQLLEDLFSRTLESLTTEEPEILARLRDTYPSASSTSLPASRRAQKRSLSKLENAEGTEKPGKSLRRSARNRTLPHRNDAL